MEAYIVTGPERSGSRFISRVVAYVLGLNDKYDWAGYGMRGKIGDVRVCLHRSQPFAGPNQFSPLQRFEEELAGYNLNFILTTRDQNIVAHSKFQHDPTGAGWRLARDQDMSRIIMSDVVLSHHRSFIWSYETMIYLGNVYFRQLYNFLDVNCDFFPDVIDGNIKYLIEQEK